MKTSFPAFAAVLLVGALALPAHAQRTWIVDATGGGHFTDLPPAVAAAADGDVLRVRPGTYTTSAISKGVRILGDPGAVLFAQFGSFVVQGIPAGRELVLQGVQLRGLLYPLLTLRGCAGTVLLDRVTAADASLSPPLTGLVRIESCTNVRLTGCALQGAAPLWIETSQVALTDVQATGNAGVMPHSLEFASSTALVAVRSRLVVARSRLQGGAGGQSPLLQRPPTPPSPGALLDACVVTLNGDAAAFVRAGGGTLHSVPAIAGAGGYLQVDPRVTLAGNGGAPVIAPTITARQQPLPSLLAGGAPPGTPVHAELLSRQGELVVLLAGLPGAVTPFPPFGGELWFDLAGPLLVVGSGVQGASERLSWQLPSVPLPSLRGPAFVLQGLSGTWPASFTVSNPVTYVLN